MALRDMDIVVVSLERGAAEGQGGKAKEEPLAVSGQHLSESVPESKEPDSGRVGAAAEMFKVGLALDVGHVAASGSDSGPAPSQGPGMKLRFGDRVGLIAPCANDSLSEVEQPFMDSEVFDSGCQGIVVCAPAVNLSRKVGRGRKPKRNLTVAFKDKFLSVPQSRLLLAGVVPNSADWVQRSFQVGDLVQVWTRKIDREAS
jgi:hypothetical protein